MDCRELAAFIIEAVGIERLDYKALYIDGICQDASRNKIALALKQINGGRRHYFQRAIYGAIYEGKYIR